MKANEIINTRISAIKSEIVSDITRGYRCSVESLEAELKKVEALKDIIDNITPEGQEQTASLVGEIIDDLSHKISYSYSPNIEKLKKIASLYKEKQESLISDFPHPCYMAVKFLTDYYKMEEDKAFKLLVNHSRDNCTVDIALSRVINFMTNK